MQTIFVESEVREQSHLMSVSKATIAKYVGFFSRFKIMYQEPAFRVLSLTLCIKLQASVYIFSLKG